MFSNQLDLDDLDPYIVVYRRLEEYLSARHELERLELIRRCLYLKVGKKLSLPPRGRSKSWQRLLLERLTAAGIPCGRVAGLHEALTSERTRRGGLLQEMPHPVAGTTHVFAPPYRLDGQRLPIRNAPPTLGAATREVLQQLLQLPEAELDRFMLKVIIDYPSENDEQLMLRQVTSQAQGGFGLEHIRTLLKPAHVLSLQKIAEQITGQRILIGLCQHRMS